MTAPSPTLMHLADAHQVATEYWDWQGAHVAVSAETIRAVLAAIGVDASDEQSTAAALADHENRLWRDTLPPTVVCTAGQRPWVPVHVPDGASLHVWIELEDGSSRDAELVDNWVEPREVDGARVGRATAQLPGDLPLGWHVLHAEVGDGSEATATLIVTPDRLDLPEPVAQRRRWGLMTQLYQVRSARSWGIGDLADLAEIGSWGADLGADFVLINPLHAAEPVTPMEASPYLPTTRRFANPIYLRIEDIDEFAYLAPNSRTRVGNLAAQGRALNAVDLIDRDAVWDLKLEALKLIFEVGLRGPRAKAFERFCTEHGAPLRTYATWCALASDPEIGGAVTSGQWPAGYEDAESETVAAYAAAHEDEIRFHCWLQWLMDLQQEAAQRAIVESGMSLGIVTDLAVGVHPEGADAWALRPVLAQGVTVGAPPDQFNQLGQNWHQPPWHPHALARAGYAPFRDMVRAVLKDSGGIRIDHVIGLFRLWLVPNGQDANAGTYLRYDHEALVGILALEAHRAGAIVVGEDLGVVEPMARDVLRHRGILGTSILWFEWTEDGQPLPPEDYRELALSSVTTHDLPPTAGYLDLAHVELRSRLGLLTRSAVEEASAELASIEKVREVLRERDLAGDESVADTVVGLHRLLAQTPSRLLGVSVSDLVGDRRIINQPGTDKEYPNWKVPLTGASGRLLPVESLSTASLPAIAAAMKSPQTSS